MKKFIMIAALALGVSVAAIAQPKAIGGRVGYSGFEVSYEHILGGSNFIELNAGLDYIYGIGAKVGATYNFMVAQPNWTNRGEWGLYVGPGITTGWVGDRMKTKISAEDVIFEGSATASYFGRGFMIGLAAQVGLEYTFWFPLQLSVDIRPYIGMHLGKYYGEYVDSKAQLGFYNAGLWGFIPTVSVRYRF